MAQTPFFSGKDAVLRVFVDGNEVVLLAKTWNVGPNVTKAADDVNGEDRSRLQSYTNYFELTAECFMDKASQVDAMLADIQNKDARAAPKDQSASIAIKILDGSRRCYAATNVSLDDWKINQGGRTERVGFTLNFRAQYFDQIPT